MAWDLATAKSKLGITGATQDAALQATMSGALELAEKYCDRQFMYAAQRAFFYHVHSDTLPLRRFPVEQVMKVDPDSRYKVHHVTGIIEFHSTQVEDEIAVDYAGGYKVLPFDLELALWNIFDSLWGASQGGGGATVQAGQISRVSLQGVGTVQFTTGAEGVASSSSGGSGLSSLVPISALSILDLYRRQSA